MRALGCLALAMVFVAGCVFDRFSPTQQLTEQVHALNDETRWGRADVAVDRVAPSYRESFLARRREWGARVRIADTELGGMVIARDTQSATTTVEISWYDPQTLEVRSTVVRQQWVKAEGGFVLEDEAVLAGDAALLTPET